MFGLMSRNRWTDPNVLISLAALAGAVLADRRQGHPQICQLLNAEGEPVLVHPDRVFAVYPSTVRIGQRRATELQVLGLDAPIVVQQDVSTVAGMLGGRWACLTVPGSWLDLGKGMVQTMVDPGQVISVQKSTYRISGMRNVLTEIAMVQGFKLQVAEDVATVAQRLGM